jgi:hypothetical protein
MIIVVARGSGNSPTVILRGARRDDGSWGWKAGRRLVRDGGGVCFGEEMDENVRGSSYLRCWTIGAAHEASAESHVRCSSRAI